MRIFKMMLVGFTLSLLVGMFLTLAQADQWNKHTQLTFSQPVEVPGQVLPAGTYTFKLSGSLSNRHIVQIWNEDATRLITTILAIPNYRLHPSDETVIEFHERPSDSPVALRAWFYPGDNFGQEFVYPEPRAIQLAEASNEIVPAETVEANASNLETVPLVAVTPDKKEESLNEAIQMFPLHDPENSASAPMVATNELPKTGSSIPLIGLLGMAFIGLAFALKLWARLLS